jgi:type II secretory pathway pseudopilin PulG
MGQFFKLTHYRKRGSMFCSNCGAPVSEGVPFCSTCGRPAQNLLATAPPQPAAYMGPQQTDGKATGSLVLGILALFPLSIFAGIPAVILGHVSRSSIGKSGGRLKGGGMALAGLIMGYISVACIPVVMIIAAIAIPNLLRAKQSANAATAASTLRTVNTAQVTYLTNYPAKGYAADLATLGPGAQADCKDANEEHACLVEGAIARPACMPGSWCSKDGYRYSLTGFCNLDHLCSEYVVVATPMSSATATKSYCSTADAVIRYKEEVLKEPLSTADECKAWPPVS